MPNSYTLYQYEHLKHHKFLGTEENSEHFSYYYKGLDGYLKILLAACNMKSYWMFLIAIKDILLLKGLSSIKDESVRQKSQTEYIAYFIILLISIIISIAYSTYMIIYIWVLPVLIAQPVHFFIELPEHFGLEAYSDTDIFRNTRTIHAPWIVRWLVNNNNYHTAHHLIASVPMSKTKYLHEKIKIFYKEFEPSYGLFFRKICSGQIRPISSIVVQRRDE